MEFAYPCASGSQQTSSAKCDHIRHYCNAPELLLLKLFLYAKCVLQGQVQLAVGDFHISCYN